VFDGILAHSSGISRMFFSHRFAQPDRTTSLHQDHDSPENYFPFSTATLDDPLTGRLGSLFRGDAAIRCFTRQYLHRILAEGRLAAAYRPTLRPARSGGRAVLRQTFRVYLIAGTQHGAYEGPADGRGHCVNPLNRHARCRCCAPCWSPSTNGWRLVVCHRPAGCRASPTAR